MNNIKRFEVNLESNLEAVRLLLANKTYVPSKYAEKIVYEPKKRTIYVLPFSPDRIIHHALMNVLEPIWTHLFIRDSYACISGRGMHSGSRRTMEFVRRNNYCLQCDISKFYPSMHHDVLKAIIRQKIKCPDTLWLIDTIIDSIPGDRNIPIGNYTSQWFGNLYLNEVDRFVKHELGVRDYVRYCDDFLLFGNDKKKLHDMRSNIQSFVGDKLKLCLSKSDVFPVGRGVDYLGYRHFRDYVLVRKSTARRIMRKIRKMPELLESGKLAPAYCRSFLASVSGWLRWANTRNLRESLSLDRLTRHIDGVCAHA